MNLDLLIGELQMLREYYGPDLEVKVLFPDGRFTPVMGANFVFQEGPKMEESDWVVALKIDSI